MKLVGPKTDFCKTLAHHVGCDFVEMEQRIFPDGEVNPRILEAPKNVILVNTLSSEDFDPNRYLLEYIFAIKNLIERGTENITLVMPYLPYSRQDAIFRKGESFTSKYTLDIFKELGITHIFAVTFHLHRQKTPVVPGITLHNVPGIDAFKDFIKSCDFKNPLFLAPDKEAEKWAERMAEPFHGDVAVLTKKRNVNTGSIETSGNVPENRNVIIIDDMISTGKTVTKALDICRQSGSTPIMVCAFHGIFSRPVIWDKNVDVVTTNTIQNPYAAVDVTPLIAQVISQEL
ncbi:MAG: ribose-phosphate diphosphokinase [Candidatus Methanofastidiosia archaeon]|jgi:ribose-phosphate pyrophosphokinase